MEVQLGHGGAPSSPWPGASIEQNGASRENKEASLQSCWNNRLSTVMNSLMGVVTKRTKATDWMHHLIHYPQNGPGRPTISTASMLVVALNVEDVSAVIDHHTQAHLLLNPAQCKPSREKASCETN